MITKLLRSKYIKATSLYTLLGVLPSLVNFLLLPIYLNYISVETYGYLALLNLYALLFTVFGSLQLNIAAGNQYFTIPSSEKHLYRHAIFLVTLFSNLIIFLIFFLLGPKLFEVFENRLDFYPLGLILLITTAIRQVQNLLMVFLKNEYKLKAIGIYSLLSMILNVGFQVVSLVYLDMGINGILYSGLLSSLLSFPILMAFHWKWLFLKSLRLSKTHLRFGLNALKFSLPFLPAVLIFQGQILMDRLVLEKYTSLTVVGQFALLITLLSVPNLLVDSLIKAIRPKVLDMLQNNETRKVMKIEQWYIAIVSFIFLGAALVGSNLHIITSSEKYQEISTYILAGVIAMLPGSLLYFKHLRLMFMGATSMISKVSMVAFISQCFLLLLLVPKFEMFGALFAIGISGLINYSLTSYKCVPSIEITKELTLLIPALIMVGLIGMASVMTHLGLNQSLSSLVICSIGTISMLLLIRKNWSTLSNWLDG